MAEWSGVVNTRTRDYVKGEQDNTIRNRKALAMLEEKGRLVFNAMHGDGDHQWQVEYKNSPVEAYGDAGTISYVRHDRWKKLVVNTRGYRATDMMTIKEKLTMGGPNQLIDRYAKIVPNLVKDLRNKLGLELYIDGYASGNDNRFIGMESFFGTGTTVAADLLATPSDTYGGLSTALGNYGGTWSSDLGTGNYPNANAATDWPNGTGDAEYDFNSPKVVNWSSTGWGTGGSTTWEDNCEKAVRQAIDWTVVSSGPEGSTDLVLLDSRLYTQFKNKFAGRERVSVTSNGPLTLKYGFSDVMNLDGVDISSEYGVPANIGYGMNFDEMELKFVQDQMYEVMGPDWDPGNAAYVYALFTFGNFTFRPKAFFKLKNVA